MSSFTSPTLETIAYLGRDSIASAFPSFPLYFIATASSYIVGSLLSQKEELEALGPNYSSRFYLSVFISSLLLMVVSTYRLYYKCEGMGTVIGSFLLGIIVGGLILYQNSMLLGKDATNLTGIPLLRERTRDMKPLYVCPQKAQV
jgi:RsiW-degrading membrane proteinase PrsW (M82 family)